MVEGRELRIRESGFRIQRSRCGALVASSLAASLLRDAHVLHNSMFMTLIPQPSTLDP